MIIIFFFDGQNQDLPSCPAGLHCAAEGRRGGAGAAAAEGGRLRRVEGGRPGVLNRRRLDQIDQRRQRLNLPVEGTGVRAWRVHAAMGAASSISRLSEAPIVRAENGVTVFQVDIRTPSLSKVRPWGPTSLGATFFYDSRIGLRCFPPVLLCA